MYLYSRQNEPPNTQLYSIVVGVESGAQNVSATWEALEGSETL